VAGRAGQRRRREGEEDERRVQARIGSQLPRVKADESPGCHAHDGEGLAAHLERHPHDIGPPVELAQPEGVGDDRGGRGSGPVVRVGEQPAERRGGAEQGEEAAGYEIRARGDRLPADRQRNGGHPHCAARGEGGNRAPIDLPIEGGEQRRAGAAPAGFPGDHDRADVLLPYHAGETAEEQRVQHAEGGGVDPDGHG